LSLKRFATIGFYAYGAPRYVLTDNGSQFTAKFFPAACRKLGIDKVFTTAYHPQTNGQVERFNRTIINSLRGYVAERQSDWDEYTSAITFGYNCRVHSSLGLTPFELVLSRPPPPLSMECPEPGTEDTVDSAKVRFLQRLRELTPYAQQQLAASQERYKRNYDRTVRTKNKEIRVGSWVYVRKETHPAGVNPKLDDQVDGPYQVLETDGHTFVLQLGAQKDRVSSDRITPATNPSAEDTTSDSSRSHNAPTRNDADDSQGEYVFERIVGARRQADVRVRVRHQIGTNFSTTRTVLGCNHTLLRFR
jgi:hypothetical protein